MSRTILVVLLALFAQPAFADDPSPQWTQDGPPCFAYSPTEERLACVALWATPGESADDSDVSSETMADSIEVAKHLKADLVQGVTLVQPQTDPFADPAHEQFITTTTDPDEELEEPLTRVKVKGVEKLLEQRGFDTPVTTLSLPVDTWVAIGETPRRLRYTLSLHEGDASFEYTGELHAQCVPNGPMWPVFQHFALGGPLAAASWADPNVLVITLEVHDGGEGWVESHREHWHLDFEAFCQDRLSSSTR